MASTKPKPLLRWSILILRAKAVWLGDVEAASEAEAIAKGAEAFKQPNGGRPPNPNKATSLATMRTEDCFS
jgi:hypothetical protein